MRACKGIVSDDVSEFESYMPRHAVWSLWRARIEIAHVQYYGWALENRAALMPTREQVERATAVVEELRTRQHGRIVIDAVVPGKGSVFTLCLPAGAER
jgi:hypothetical protein